MQDSRRKPILVVTGKGRRAMIVPDKERCCGTCRHHKPFAGEWGCDNEESENYALETAYDDYCEEYEEKEDN